MGGAGEGLKPSEEARSHHPCEKHLLVAKLAKPRFRVAGLFAPGPAAAEKVTVAMRTGRACSGLSPRLGLQECVKRGRGWGRSCVQGVCV